MKPGSLIFASFIVAVPLLAGTPEAIANIYNGSKITNNINAYISGQKNFIPAPSPASQKLLSASQYSRIASGVNSIQTTNLQKFNNAIPVELMYLYRSIDATAKVQTIKNLHSDLLSAMIQQNILESETLMLPLREEYGNSIENEFKKAKK
ncbi:MAG: hypothetical protein PHT07_10555 [Paludibacter sp.]|nr:hypothetical protein [Paludibacter sp.]